MEDVEYFEGVLSVVWRVFSTVKGYHLYCGRIPTIIPGEGYPQVLWRIIITMDENQKHYP